jgi:hypothetical protein
VCFWCAHAGAEAVAAAGCVCPSPVDAEGSAVVGSVGVGAVGVGSVGGSAVIGLGTPELCFDGCFGFEGWVALAGTGRRIDTIGVLPFGAAALGKPTGGGVVGLCGPP